MGASGLVVTLVGASFAAIIGMEVVKYRNAINRQVDERRERQRLLRELSRHTRQGNES